MIVDHHALQADLKVLITTQHPGPFWLFFEESLAIIASNLEVPAILAKTETEHPLLDQLLIKHHIVDGFELIDVFIGFFLG